MATKTLLYHGSAVSGLTELQPLSTLHGKDQKVVYLSSCIPYVLLYIWDKAKTGYSQKWVTGWIKDGITYYEEQFPGQLKAFYDGVPGYIYSVLANDDTGTVQQRENMLYCNSPVPVHGVIKIDDVYQELLHYEEKGLFRILRYEEASAEKQKELVDRIAQYINMNNLHEANTDHAQFMMRYFTEAWRKTK